MNCRFSKSSAISSGLKGSTKLLVTKHSPIRLEAQFHVVSEHLGEDVGSTFGWIPRKTAMQNRRKRIGRAASTSLQAIENFKKRISLHSMKAIRDATTTDPMASAKYPENFQNIIEKGYTRQEVSNIDETDLFQEQSLTRTFIFKNRETSPGLKNSAVLSIVSSLQCFGYLYDKTYINLPLLKHSGPTKEDLSYCQCFGSPITGLGRLSGYCCINSTSALLMTLNGIRSPRIQRSKSFW